MLGLYFRVIGWQKKKFVAESGYQKIALQIVLIYDSFTKKKWKYLQLTFHFLKL